MYGTTRFLTNNLITAAMLTTNSQEPGMISGVLKEGLGSAVMYAAGDYSGNTLLLFTVQIDDVTAGKEVGQATFRWRESSQAEGVWNASGVTTPATLTTLNNGVQIKFDSGTGDDFEGGELFTFYAFPSFAVTNILAFDRETFFRSAALASPNTISIDFSTAQSITACVIFDHNLTSGATVTLKAGTTSACSDYSKALTVAENIVEYLSQSYRYWKLEITDATNPDGYIEIGELYLGTYTELTDSPAPDWGSAMNLETVVMQQETSFGLIHGQVNALLHSLDLKYGLLNNTDFTTLRTLYLTLYNTTSGVIAPLFLHLFSDETDFLFLAKAEGGLPRNFDRYNQNSASLKFREVPQSRRA